MNNDTAPYVIDVNLSGMCPLRCDFCWGARHEIEMLLSVDQWKHIIHDFILKGVGSIVFTGGEPLVHKEAVELMRYAKLMNIKVSLSTNGVFADRLEEVSKYLDLVGIPLDGSNNQRNARMRPPIKDHFDKALAAMKLVKKSNPRVFLTVRTVVSRISYDDVLNIGRILRENNIAVDRWKLYRFAPTGGYGTIVKERHWIEENRYMELVRRAKSQFNDLNVDYLDFNNRWGRYLFVMPDGRVSTVNESGLRYIHLGNSLDDLNTVFSKFKQVLLKNHLNHGFMKE